MTLSNSVDYLTRNGVVDFDVDAYLNNPNAKGVNYTPNMLGGTTMQAQPQKDTFSSKLKAKVSDKGFLKKAAATVAVAALAVFGIKKGKNLLSTAKNSNVGQQACNYYGKAKNWVTNLFKKA
ncbi:hypothetical protein IKE67_01640 [bacterium]|nr:hypothetical protein [bacterium]